MVVAAAILLAACSAGSEGDLQAPSAGSSSSIRPPASGKVDEVLPSKPQKTKSPVRVGKKAKFGDEVTVALTGRKRISIEAEGPGESSGAGQLYILEFENAGSNTINLDRVLVVADDRNDSPLWAVQGDPTEPFAGDLEPGQKARGRYAFVVGKDLTKGVVLTVTYSTDAPAVELRT